MDSIVIEKQTATATDFDELVRGTIEMTSLVGSPINLQTNNNTDCSEGDEVPKKRIRKRIQKLSDSDSDPNQEMDKSDKEQSDSKSKNDTSKSVYYKSKTRITLKGDTDSDPEVPKFMKNEEQQIRMMNKNNKIKEKFKDLLKSRRHEQKPKHDNSHVTNTDSSSAVFDKDMSSIEKIKQIINERTTFISSLCDPDTSDEEDSLPKQKPLQKKERKSVKATSPKPIRMSAKQAMENMHKIKSESNRLLREKEVSLPYHRPKALRLKDIMSRRKPAVNADGKALPIKMNEVQLKQYASSLEKRQKEMIELCKSDSDDENDKDEPSIDTETTNSNNLEESIDNKTSKSQNNICMNDQCMIDQCTEKDQSINSQENQSLLGKNLETDIQNSVSNNEDNCNEICNIDLANSDNFNSHIDNMKSNTSTDNLENMCIDRGSKENNYVQEADNSSELPKNLEQPKAKSKPESQLIHLHYDSETIKDTVIGLEEINEPPTSVNMKDSSENEDNKELQGTGINDFTFSDDDLDMDDIDKLIENAEIIKDTQDKTNSPDLIRDHQSLNIRPKLTGAPGTIIHLDGTDSITSRKLTGVELLKERFSYFARIKTPEELEREKEKKLKPGSLHSRLKQKLEDEIAEQRSLEWAKRLEEEKQQQLEIKALRGEESDVEDDIDKIEAKLEEKKDSNDIDKENSSSGEEVIEDDIVLKDKPRVKNAMIDDEAEESDCDDDKANNDSVHENDKSDDSEENDSVSENDNHDDSDDDDTDDESSEDEETTSCKKGRILKAFEDSDDEDNKAHNIYGKYSVESDVNTKNINISAAESETQDVEIQLAQNYKSEDLVTSQESGKAILVNSSKENDAIDDNFNKDKQLGVFSIASSKLSDDTVLQPAGEITDTQPFVDDNFIPVCEAPLSTNTQSILPSQLSTQESQSQPIGEDILALCTGKFYDNEFISQPVQNYTQSQETIDCESQELTPVKLYNLKECNVAVMNKTDIFSNIDINKETPKINKNIVQNDNNLKNSVADKSMKDITEDNFNITGNINECSKVDSLKDDKPKTEDSNILKSILDELYDPQFDARKPNMFFVGNTNKVDNPLKKKFVIDSDDDDMNEENASFDSKKKKKIKKRKPEKRALQISDDEEDDIDDDEEEYDSEIEEDSEQVVEYDSEENEVLVNLEQPKKKKRKVADFFEQEAELTSEDEWVGSGDEDEAGLDRMEREEGDDEKFNQRLLQRELEQIHMRDVLDQDKREVRIIQELLFEDGDLGAGSRQRKFRWKNADGGEETDMINDDITDTQEEEFESEEQWRKQRHEREVFLRQMKNEHESSLNISVNRTSIIKASLSSKSTSNVLLEATTDNVEKTEKAVSIEKKTSKDIPSPKKPFTIFQQNYHGSLLTRGRGALARLAALATPLAVDDDAPKVGSLAPSSRRNFVFAALSQDETKATKRKAETVGNTPKLVKKMKLEAKQKYLKNSLLDHLKV
ncbi:hypothetical protein K1T71_010802 [Dendrolimus kikuchii]|uniref:Uncharacterized protein n=1 Tax=Dendrolimus kikuchii TaxID=765133 RepID=A0ACC1CQ38_9NEOP|nr:hypothetical protein K1T71_010802 [Dendrolimus kikuchii]